MRLIEVLLILENLLNRDILIELNERHILFQDLIYDSDFLSTLHHLLMLLLVLIQRGFIINQFFVHLFDVT